MYRSVVPNPLEIGTIRGRRKLSRRRVRALVRVHQAWCDVYGHPWIVVNIYRKDGQVALVGPGESPRYVTFGELGRSYELVEDDER